MYTIWKWLVKIFFFSNFWTTLFENLTTILDRLWSYARDMADTEWYWRVFKIPCNVLNYFQCFQKHLVDCLNVWRLFNSTSLYLHHLEGESWNLVLKIELPIVNKFSPADVFAKVVECARKRRLGHLENS